MERNRKRALSQSDRHGERDLSAPRAHPGNVRLAERKFRRSRILIRRRELVCTVGKGTVNDAFRTVYEWLAGIADGSEWRLRGSHRHVQLREQRHPSQPLPVTPAIQVGANPAAIGLFLSRAPLRVMAPLRPTGSESPFPNCRL